MTEKRDESRLPPIWVPLYEGRLNTCDDCEHETVHGAFIREADAKLEDIEVEKYAPASELEAALARVWELETAAVEFKKAYDASTVTSYEMERVCRAVEAMSEKTSDV